MNQNNFKIIKLTLVFIGALSLVLALGFYFSQFYFEQKGLEYPLVVKVYKFLAFSSFVLITATAILFVKVSHKMPIYFLVLTVFKLGLFISMFLTEDDLPFRLRVAILIPIMTCLIIEKTFAYLLFKKLDIQNSDSK